MHVLSNFQFFGFLSSKATIWIYKKLLHNVLPVGDARNMEKRIDKGKRFDKGKGITDALM